MKALLIYYSRSDMTRTVAKALARELSCDTEEIRETKSRLGIRGYIQCIVDTYRDTDVPLEKMENDPSHYDLIILGTPVWGSAVSAPMRTYIRQNKDRFNDVAFFVTYGGAGAKRVLREMEELSKRTPIATLDLREREIRDHKLPLRMEFFTDEIRRVYEYQHEKELRSRAV